jgi:serine/threonine protein kinase
MPVEQLKGEHLGPATDLYATGLVLYEMLVGRPAFVGETAVDTALAVMQGGSVTVPAGALVAGALRAIIAKACSRHAEDRYQSARAFLEALNALDVAFLDVDAADKEHFTAGSPDALRREPPARVAKAPPIAGEDREDLVPTQAISTDDLLAAKPPLRGLSQQRRSASTESIAISSITGPSSPTSDPPGRSTRAPPLLVLLDVAILVVALIILLRVL